MVTWITVNDRLKKPGLTEENAFSKFSYQIDTIRIESFGQSQKPL